MHDYDAHILRGMTHWQHPMFFGYFPSNATYEGILADMYASMTTNPAFNWSAAPAVTELEFVVLDWIASMLNLAPEFHGGKAGSAGGGVILGSASESTLVMAIAARERAVRREADRLQQPEAEVRAALLPKLIMYCSTQTHSSGQKAAKILGLQCRALPVTRDDHFELRGDVLRAALDEDLAAGLHPFYLVSTYGTTNTCAMDRLPELASVAQAYPQLWLHVDAAYAGVAWSLPEYRDANWATVNSHCDSVSTNLHKWGLVPFESSPTFVRQRADVMAALELTPEYLRTRGSHDLAWDLRNMQLSLGRRFRALKVWFVLRSYGVHGFQTHLRTCIELAQAFARELEQSAYFELLDQPRFGLVLFRLAQRDVSADELAARHERLNDALSQRSADVLLTPTVLPSVGACLRLVVGSPRTQLKHITAAYRLLEECAAQATSQ